MRNVDDLGASFRRMPVALYRTAPSGEILSANVALANLLGYATVAELKAGAGSVESIYVDPGQRERWIAQIADQDVVHDFDVELRRADRSTVWVRDTARAIRDERGEVVYYEGSLIDVTDKIEAQRAKDEFIATVSHELRNPIAVMLGLGDELANEYDSFSDSERRNMAQLIARQADDASRLIEDLLVAYRDDVGQVLINPETFDVGKEVERVLEVVDHPVELEVLGGTRRVRADPRRTRQILRNLITNAIRYGGDRIRVQVTGVADMVETRVQDSGDPIPETDLDRIFKPFERGGAPSHPKSVGLGLSVASRLAELMEGEVAYRHQEGWSTFVLSLPAA